MPKKDAPANFDLTTDPIFANVGEVTDDKSELVFIYGKIGKVTDDTICLHQCLNLRKYYEIPRCAIVFVEFVVCVENKLTKIILYATTRITYVSGQARATLPASTLANVVEENNNKVRNPEACPPVCLCGAKCWCAAVDHWLKLDGDTAKKLGVEVSKAPPGTQ